jgi:hypothetical protein
MHETIINLMLAEAAWSYRKRMRESAFFRLLFLWSLAAVCIAQIQPIMR